MSFPDALVAAVLESQSDAIIASDKAGIIVYWNPGAERIFGFSSADAVGQSLDIIIPERLRKRHWDGYHHVMNGGESRYGHADLLAVPGIKKDGSGLSVEFTIMPMKDAGDQITGLVAIMRDGTKHFEEMRTLRHQVAAASKVAR